MSDNSENDETKKIPPSEKTPQAKQPTPVESAPIFEDSPQFPRVQKASLTTPLRGVTGFLTGLRTKMGKPKSEADTAPLWLNNVKETPRASEVVIPPFVEAADSKSPSGSTSADTLLGMDDRSVRAQPAMKMDTADQGAAADSSAQPDWFQSWKDAEPVTITPESEAPASPAFDTTPEESIPQEEIVLQQPFAGEEPPDGWQSPFTDGAQFPEPEQVEFNFEDQLSFLDGYQPPEGSLDNQQDAPVADTSEYTSAFGEEWGKAESAGEDEWKNLRMETGAFTEDQTPAPAVPDLTEISSAEEGYWWRPKPEDEDQASPILEKPLAKEDLAPAGQKQPREGGDVVEFFRDMSDPQGFLAEADGGQAGTVSPRLEDNEKQGFFSGMGQMEKILLGIIAGLLVIGIFLILVQSVPGILPAASPQITATPAATATLTEAEITPVFLQLTGGWSFDLKQGTLVNGQWEPQGPEWLAGTELRKVVALPWTRQLQAFALSLQVGDQVALVMNNNQGLAYKVKSIEQVEPTDTAILKGTTPSLVIILYQKGAPLRLVVVCEQ
jgi:hypothetical protein